MFNSANTASSCTGAACDVAGDGADKALCCKESSAGQAGGYCNVNHDGTFHPCKADSSDYCCDCQCTYCGPKDYCNSYSPFGPNDCGICNPGYTGSPLCMNHFESCTPGDTVV